MKRTMTFGLFLLVVVVTLVVWSGGAAAQVRPGEKDYRYKAGDKVYLSVPERPSMNQELVLDQNGNVSLPLVGDIPVAGLTVEEMHERIYRAFHDLYPSITKSDMTIEPVLSHVVYITGEVDRPGRYEFADQPGLWDAIREAGGPTAEAALDVVRIVDDESLGGGSSVVNVLKALEMGTVDQLPLLNEESTVVVPSEAESYVGSLGVNVIGAVVDPGFYRIPEDHNTVMDAIILAGGPTQRAELKKILVIRMLDDGTLITKNVDMKLFIEHGDAAANPKLQAGDTINVREMGSLKYQLTHNIGIYLSFIATIGTLILIIDRVNN